VLARVSKLEEVCREFDVPLKFEALQFVVAHPTIPTIIPGVRSVTQLRGNLETFEAEIPSDFWIELRRQALIREDAPTPLSLP
jgi:D-threo-aldose 1-dehydrogenase